MGLAGVDWPDDIPRMRSALAEAGLLCEISLENDSFSAVRACAPEGHGIGVTAGTGIAAGIVRPDGETYFYGGFTDMGGGGDINGRALHAVIRAEDGRGRPTSLTPALLEATGYPSVPELLYDMHRRGYHPPMRVLRPLLFDAARDGDPAAVGIVTDFGRELALCATNLVRRYGLAEEAIAVVAAGTLFVKTGPLLFDVFQQAVLAGAPPPRPAAGNGRAPGRADGVWLGHARAVGAPEHHGV
jgi:N-acetylglucosamine kinase-like BadF-type ATPase